MSCARHVTNDVGAVMGRKRRVVSCATNDVSSTGAATNRGADAMNHVDFAC